VDDHSRFCVIATAVARATARAVCTVFATALIEYGVPEQVLTDNGKQFTGKYGRPRPAEVLFDRNFRKNGIEHLLTKPRSPTTTGKIERWHQSIRTEFLDEQPWLALLLVRVAERRTGQTWHHINTQLSRVHQVRLQGPTARSCKRHPSMNHSRHCSPPSASLNHRESPRSAPHDQVNAWAHDRPAPPRPFPQIRPAIRHDRLATNCGMRGGGGRDDSQLPATPAETPDVSRS
jgi:transposase InsO family protein